MYESELRIYINNVRQKIDEIVTKAKRPCWKFLFKNSMQRSNRGFALQKDHVSSTEGYDTKVRGDFFSISFKRPM